MTQRKRITVFKYLKDCFSKKEGLKFFMSLHIQTKTKKTGVVLTIQSKRVFVSPKSRGGCLVECVPIIRSNLVEMGGLLVDIPDFEMAPNDSCLLIFMACIMTSDMNSADLCKQYNIWK